MSFASLASSAMASLRSALGIPLAKLPLDGVTFISYVLPPMVCYFIAAVLVVTPQTRMVRFALSPLVVLLSLRVALSVDTSQGGTAQGSDFRLFLPVITTRALDWALVQGPFKRHSRPANSSPSTIMDALDLVSSLRGVGWDWSRGLYIPRQTRPSNRTQFVLYTALSVIGHGLLRGVLQRVILTLLTTGVGPIPGEPTIFDNTLPPFLRSLRASTITFLGFSTMYAVTQMAYDLCTIIGVLVLGQDPVQWPPIFDAPWRSTSLTDFWGRRWHQLIRRPLLFLGGYPLSLILGRSGVVIGSFLASAVIHHFTLLALNNQIEFWWMLVGFGMMALGILAERVLYQSTGRKMGGVVGWFWMMAWILSWGSMIIGGFAKAGLIGCVDIVDSLLPAWVSSVEHSVADFDAWLHTI